MIAHKITKMSIKNEYILTCFSYSEIRKWEDYLNLLFDR